MPPDDEFMHLIVRSNDGTFTTDGHVVNEEEWSDIAKSENHKWTPYTAEKWEALHGNRS